MGAISLRGKSWKRGVLRRILQPVGSAAPQAKSWFARKQGRCAVTEPRGSRYAGFCALGPLFRACTAIAIIEVPPNSMLVPTSEPNAHAAVPGSRHQIMKARIRSTIPLTSIQVQGPESSLLCSIAYMLQARPSMLRNMTSTSVSEKSSRIGPPSSMIPATIPTTAETNVRRWTPSVGQELG